MTVGMEVCLVSEWVAGLQRRILLLDFGLERYYSNGVKNFNFLCVCA